MARKELTWSPEDQKYLVENFSDKSNSTLASELGKTVGGIRNKAHSLKLKKSNEFKEKNSGRFMSVDPRRMTKNFLPGFNGTRYKEIGSERIDARGCRERKINDGADYRKRWKLLSHIVWEEANGPIPEGYRITFKDGNKQNVELSNLELCTNADLIKRNSVNNLPPDLRRAFRALTELKKEIKNGTKR